MHGQIREIEERWPSGSVVGPHGHERADAAALAGQIRAWGRELGFDGIGFARAVVPQASVDALAQWLAAGRHGDMDYMARHAALRGAPAQLLPQARTIISATLPYWPAAADAAATLAAPARAYVSRYALGRDYHKLIRGRLQHLIDRIHAETGPTVACRACSDSAPVLEVDFAQRAGLGWRGKHTLLLDRRGSWRFLGEILTTLDLPPDPEVSDHCGSCTRCISACPTEAIIAPYQVDARRCISYLTIEHAGSIPEPLRPQLGNRIYGCDDCQLACPWNRFATLTPHADFGVRNGLDHAALSALFGWSANDFADRLAGSPIRRIGHVRWLRNIAVALGNAAPDADVTTALTRHADHPEALVREHVGWALARQAQATGSAKPD